MKNSFEEISGGEVNSILQSPGEVQEIIQKTNNVSNAIIEATEKSYPKVIQIDGPYISRISKTKFKAEDLLGDPALLQIELPKGHYFPDRTNSKILTFEVKSPGMTDEINLDVMNEDDIIVDRINYQLRWAA